MHLGSCHYLQAGRKTCHLTT